MPSVGIFNNELLMFYKVYFHTKKNHRNSAQTRHRLVEFSVDYPLKSWRKITTNPSPSGWIFGGLSLNFWCNIDFRKKKNEQNALVGFLAAHQISQLCHLNFSRYCKIHLGTPIKQSPTDWRTWLNRLTYFSLMNIFAHDNIRSQK